nr:uncharacterized protein LOC125180464 isoform X1 [Anser cygnoides]
MGETHKGPGSVPAGGCCQPAAREAVNGLVPALPGTCSWTAGRWLFLKGIRPLVTQLPWNRRKGELEGTLKADMKNRLFAPSAVALSVFEDFHYVFPRSPRGQTEGSRYRQPVLRDGLSSGSGDGRSGTGRACRHGWGELFTVLVPVGVSRGEPGRLGEVVVPSCRRCGECWLQSCWPWGWAPLQNVLHPSVPRLRSCWHGVLCRGVLVGPRWVRS